MPRIQHVLSFNENLNSYPEFRFEVHCSCGFSGRLARKDLAESQGKNHLLHNGVMVNIIDDFPEGSVEKPFGTASSEVNVLAQEKKEDSGSLQSSGEAQSDAKPVQTSFRRA